MTKKLIIIAFVQLLIGNLIAQTTPDIENYSFQENEKLKYVASFYISGLWSDVVEVNMDVSKIDTKTRSLYRIKCTANSYSKWDTYFDIRDFYESYVDMNSVKPFIFKRNIDEGGYTKNVKYVYKRKSGVVNATIKRRSGDPKSSQVKIKNDTYDFISALYYLRNVDFSKSKVGDVVKVKVLADSKYDVKEMILGIKYLGTEDLKTDKYGTKKCYKLSVFTNDSDKISANNANNIWLTADKNQVPLLIKTKISVGSLQVRLTEMSGLRN